MAHPRFNGVLAPVITPFRDDLTPDPALLGKHCRWLVSQGAGLAVFGTNSEANSLNLLEKRGLLDSLSEEGIDPSQLMPGTGGCALTDAVELTTHAVSLGCRGVLMLPPFYYKGVSDDGLFAFYAEVIERVANEKLQIYLYHIPPISQVPIGFDLIQRLAAAYPASIAGIKDSSGDWNNTLQLNQLGIDDFRVFCGSESFLLQNMQNGGAGCISATANVNPAAINDLYENWQDEGADQKQAQLDQVRAIFQSFPMIAALKAATAQFAGESTWLRVRPPLVSLSGQELKKLIGELQGIGFQMPDI
ncbi:MAG: dihydrodipicolinate synthase family protein [Gammaproteobacteria bacterium]